MVTMGKLPQTPRAKKVIEYAIEEARNLNHNYVGTEHLLLGLLREKDGVAAQVLMNLNLKLEDVREEV
jgi:ATP-dependent Clp protease ATP-binding subunit ClpC